MEAIVYGGFFVVSWFTMYSLSKDREIVTYNKEHKITEIIRTIQQEKISNSDSTKNWEHGAGAPVG